MKSVDMWTTFVLYHVFACCNSCKTLWKLERFPQSVPKQHCQATAQGQVADSVLRTVGGLAMFGDQLVLGFGWFWMVLGPRKINGARLRRLCLLD